MAFQFVAKCALRRLTVITAKWVVYLVIPSSSAQPRPSSKYFDQPSLSICLSFRSFECMCPISRSSTLYLFVRAHSFVQWFAFVIRQALTFSVVNHPSCIEYPFMSSQSSFLSSPFFTWWKQLRMSEYNVLINPRAQNNACGCFRCLPSDTFSACSSRNVPGHIAWPIRDPEMLIGPSFFLDATPVPLSIRYPVVRIN